MTTCSNFSVVVEMKSNLNFLTYRGVMFRNSLDKDREKPSLQYTVNSIYSRS